MIKGTRLREVPRIKSIGRAIKDASCKEQKDTVEDRENLRKHLLRLHSRKPILR
jgi:hypothetical protein